MLMCNKTISTLNFCNSINDTVLRCIARGMAQNHNVHTIIITISGISDDALCSLLLSLSHSPLTVKVVDDIIYLMRYISETNSESMGVSTDFKEHISSLLLEPPDVCLSSTELKRVLSCLNHDSSCLKEFEFSFESKNYWHNQIIVLNSSTVDLSLKRIKSLQTLKLCNPVTSDVIRKLATGLDGNNTLTHLALHPRTLTVGNVKTIFEALHTTSIIKLEFINEWLFFRDQGGTAQWKLEVVKCDRLMVLPTAYNALNKLLNTSRIEIATIIDKNIRNMELKFPDINNNYLALLILRSMEEGEYLVRKLDLIFKVDIDNPRECGNAIERMLKSCKSLKKLTIVNLTNDIIASYLIAGLAQNSSLSQLYIKGHCIYDSIFVQKLFKMHLVSPAIHKICINDEISLQRKSQSDSWKRLNSERTLNETFSDIMMTTLGTESNTDYEASDSTENLPMDGSWRVMPISEKNSMLSTFCLLNRIMCNACTTSVGGLMLEYFQNLDLSGTRLTYKQLASLFEELEKNTSVVSLDVSFSILYNLPRNLGLNVHNTLKRMLERNTTIKTLNLTGIVDDNVAAVLANAIPSSSLITLSVNFTTKDYSFNELEDLLYSFMCSKHLITLEFTNFCIIQRKESLMHFSLTQCRTWQLPPNVELLQSWCILFIFHVLGKHCNVSRSGLCISVNKHLNDGLMKRVFQMFFNAAKVDPRKFTVAKNLVTTLQELHLDITVQSFALFSIMIEPFKSTAPIS